MRLGRGWKLTSRELKKLVGLDIRASIRSLVIESQTEDAVPPTYDTACPTFRPCYLGQQGKSDIQMS